MTTGSLCHGSNTASSLARSAAPSGTTLSRAADAVLNLLQRDRDRRALQRLDDRLLLDIGVSRGEVEIEANKPFWRG